MDQSMHEIIQEAIEKVKREHGVHVNSIIVEWDYGLTMDSSTPYKVSIDSSQTND